MGSAEGEILEKLNPSYSGGGASGGGGGFGDFQPDAFLADKYPRDFGRAGTLRPGAFDPAYDMDEATLGLSLAKLKDKIKA